MNCLNPRYKRYYDAFSGEPRTLCFGCGKCVNCLAAEQDSWSIRITETAEHCESFIYETLTFRPSAFEDKLLDVSDALADPDFIVQPETAMLLDYWFDRYGYGNLPLFEKSVLSDWIKRGRENYFADTGKRLKMKYLFCMELGPEHSRPHAHGLIFGVSLSVYKKYFANPWKKDYGFLYTKEIRHYVNNHKDIQCVARYVSKYINKGAFESPLVKNGLLPKPWRMVSNGIGEEFLNDSRWSFMGEYVHFRNTLRRRSMKRVLPDGTVYSVPSSLSRGMGFHNWSSSNPIPFIKFDSSQLQKFISYVDDSGFNHRLPRYYRDRLLGRDPNFLKYSVQSSLLALSRLRRYKKLQEIASTLSVSGNNPAIKAISGAYVGDGVSSLPMYLASFVLATIEKQQREREARRHFDSLKNHYNRPKRSGSRSYQLTQ